MVTMQEFLELLRNVIPILLQGAVVTVQIAAVSLLLGVLIGLPVGIGRVYGPPWLQRILGAYVTLFQGTPLLIQLFLVYYGLPDLGLTLGRLTAAYVTLGLNSGAYQAEYLRGALQSVSEGQMTAARAIGMSKAFRPSAASSCRRRCAWCCRPGRTRRLPCSKTPPSSMRSPSLI